MCVYIYIHTYVSVHVQREREREATIEFRQFLGDIKKFFFEQFLAAVAREGDGRMNIKEFTKFHKQLGNWAVEGDPAALPSK